jgi:hypothetical protein
MMKNTLQSNDLGVQTICTVVIVTVFAVVVELRAWRASE